MYIDVYMYTYLYTHTHVYGNTHNDLSVCSHFGFLSFCLNEACIFVQVITSTRTPLYNTLLPAHLTFHLLTLCYKKGQG